MSEYSVTDGSDPCVETTLRGHRQAVNCVSFSGDGKQLVSGSDDNNVMLWSLDDKQSICYRLVGHSSSVQSVVFTPQFLLSSSKDCTVRLWRMNRISGRHPENESVVYRCHSSSIRCVSASADASAFCTASDDKTVKIWSPIATNKFIGTLSGVHTNWVRHAKYSRLNQHLIGSCGDDGLVAIWDVRTRDAVIQLTPRRKSTHFTSLEWHPNCEHIISSSSADTSIRIWDLRKEKMIQYYAAHTGAVNATDFHASGNYLISASSDETSKIFDLLEGRGLFTLKAHNGAVNACAFTPDGQYFATAGNDKQIMIWKSNLMNGLDRSEYMLQLDEPIDEPLLLNPRDHIRPQSHSTPQSSKASKFQTPVMNGNRVPLKSALRRSCSEEIKPMTTTPKQTLYTNARHSTRWRDRVDGRDVRINNSGDHLNSAKSESITQTFINQLKTLTDSVLLIEERLSTLEDKFETHCTAPSAHGSSNG
ncbi:unnamed protein product [Medioppia subpectinata]|uniref:Uncharacterized protein n=1 Tax=Medioppia subpectinata TaxID=1979941 RepID=A0A7R9KFH7_9ACAR|nr:unnamed protein product [Medioppia subpectinata]CAG2102406.1 unnamed protein product [Medioppia subpectinata]